MMPSPTPHQKPVSIICVFNDPEVRRNCLDRSIEEHRDEATVEYLPIDNVDGSFASAGAALNHGAALASHDHLVFVHQDVYLHSLSALATAAGILAGDESIGVLGAIGFASDGKLVGRIRDRVVLLGEPSSQPTDVDSLDELLFMVPRRLLETEPLSEAPELAWHAYALEYGLRARSRGLRTCAVDVPLTHNSLTVNTDRLDLAHRAVAATYPDALPLRNGGATLRASAQPRTGSGIINSHRWRYRWLRESVAIHSARRAAGGGQCVLGDLRVDIDEVMAWDPSSSLLVVNLERGPEFVDVRPGPLTLIRRGQPIMLTSQPADGLIKRLETWSSSISLVLTNLGIADVRLLSSHLPPEPRLLGFRSEIGYWMLLGEAAAAIPGPWRSSKATPMGMPTLTPS